MNKDDARVERSIQRMLSRSDVYFAKCAVLRALREKEFENYCITNNLIYFL